MSRSLGWTNSLKPSAAMLQAASYYPNCGLCRDCIAKIKRTAGRFLCQLKPVVSAA
jgi:hypothetical protein